MRSRYIQISLNPQIFSSPQAPQLKMIKMVKMIKIIKIINMIKVIKMSQPKTTLALETTQENSRQLETT